MVNEARVNTSLSRSASWRLAGCVCTLAMEQCRRSFQPWQQSLRAQHAFKLFEDVCRFVKSTKYKVAEIADDTGLLSATASCDFMIFLTVRGRPRDVPARTVKANKLFWSNSVQVAGKAFPIFPASQPSSLPKRRAHTSPRQSYCDGLVALQDGKSQVWLDKNSSWSSYCLCHTRSSRPSAGSCIC